MASRKNVIVFCTDQQRADSLGCTGNRFARTPNIDALAARGVLYANHFATNPVCMPSRASFVTGRCTFAHRVLDNGIWLPPGELTMPEVFRRHGYVTASFGKLHFQTYKSYPGDRSMESMARWESGELDAWTGPYYGFEKVLLTTAHGEGCGGHYGRWRKKNFPRLSLGPENAQSPEKYPTLHSWKSNVPLEAYHSTWVADRAVEYLDSVAGRPFYLNVSFPDPHSPFTPPAPYSTMFDSVKFDPPHAVEGENDAKPLPYRAAMTGRPFGRDGGARLYAEFTGAAYTQVLAHTHGMIALVDDCVGRVLAKLDSLGLGDNTLVVFTSDHGDFLGDHHMLYKGQLPCKSLLEVPLIIADPAAPSGRVDYVSSNVDVMPTLLSRCGIDVPGRVQGVVLPEAGERPARDWAFEAGWSKVAPEYHHFTVYTRQFRVSYFPYLDDGELYDLESDPYEHRNLYHEPAFSSRRESMMQLLLSCVGKAEPKMPDILADW
jgi:arylsulfatase A-like enzyme